MLFVYRIVIPIVVGQATARFRLNPAYGRMLASKNVPGTSKFRLDLGDLNTFPTLPRSERCLTGCVYAGAEPAIRSGTG